MTREEEIKKQSKIYSDDADNYVEWGNGWEDYDDIETVEKAFIQGAKWADKHPYLREEEQVGMGGLGMVWQKQALIKKACEWLNNELFEDKAEFNPYYDTDVKSKSYDTLDQFIDNFKKAMEAELCL